MRFWFTVRFICRANDFWKLSTLGFGLHLIWVLAINCYHRSNHKLGPQGNDDKWSLRQRFEFAKLSNHVIWLLKKATISAWVVQVHVSVMLLSKRVWLEPVFRATVFSLQHHNVGEKQAVRHLRCMVRRGHFHFRWSLLAWKSHIVYTSQAKQYRRSTTEAFCFSFSRFSFSHFVTESSENLDARRGGHSSPCNYFRFFFLLIVQTAPGEQLLYKFCNVRASSIRTVMIARPRRIPEAAMNVDEQMAWTPAADNERLWCADGMQCEPTGEPDRCNSTVLSSPWSDDEEDESGCGGSERRNLAAGRASACAVPNSAADGDEEMLLVFTRGAETYTPHQIGVKRIVKKDLMAVNMKAIDRPDDTVDHVVEMSGHIIGMSLSPDHR